MSSALVHVGGTLLLCTEAAAFVVSPAMSLQRLPGPRFHPTQQPEAMMAGRAVRVRCAGIKRSAELQDAFR